MYDVFYSIRAVNLYPVELKNIPLGLSKKRTFMTDIVAKLWGFCHTLRHDGIDYGDYIEELPSSNKSVQWIVSLRRL